MLNKLKRMSNKCCCIFANKTLKIVLTELSESSLDIYNIYFDDSVMSGESNEYRNRKLQEAVDYLHSDYPLMEAAEVGNSKRIAELLQLFTTDVQHRDHLGRTALHLAVCYGGNVQSIKLLLETGISPNIKDNLGMTPLSLCLMRNPSLTIANLLFDNGAKILPKTCPMDTGLFIQFVSMCVPTDEEEQLLELLLRKGAVINDPDAPGGRQVLHIAAMSDNCRLIKILIELGANPNMKNHRGETPKQFAFIFKCKEAYDILDQYDDDSLNSLNDVIDTSPKEEKISRRLSDESTLYPFQRETFDDKTVPSHHGI